jgi:hypothetical protein
MTEPEIIFSAVCGPGVMTRNDQLPIYMYVVYSISPAAYMGFPECAPHVDPKQIVKKIENDIIPNAFRDNIENFFIARDDDFLKSLWTGSLWPIVSLFSPVHETFSEGGAYLYSHRNSFLCQETLRRWIANDLNMEKDAVFDGFSAWSYSDMLLSGKPFSAILGTKEQTLINKRIKDKDFRLAEYNRLVQLYKAAKPKMKQRMPKTELNEMLMTIRALA